MSEHTPQAAPAPRRALHPAVRGVISLVLVAHLAAVFLPPFSLQARGPFAASPLTDPLMRSIRPYVDLLYLDHGYAFFAPDPGPSHLIRARLEFADGRPPLELMFPDLRRHWPRLLYHRHFMLSEQLHADFLPPQPPEGLRVEDDQFNNWQVRRGSYELKWHSYRDHLRAKYGASRVTLTRVRHRIIDVPEVEQRGRRLSDPETYLDLPEEDQPGETP